MFDDIMYGISFRPNGRRDSAVGGVSCWINFGSHLRINGAQFREGRKVCWPSGRQLTVVCLHRSDISCSPNMWFQQNGATSHTAWETLNLLDEKFKGFIISRGGDINWPPRSCDLTPLDYSLWGYMKSLVYADKPQIAALKTNMVRVLREIEPHLCEDVIQDWSTRIHHLQRSYGGRWAEIIFHTHNVIEYPLECNGDCGNIA